MNQYDETFQTWNKIAKLYESKFMHMDLYNQTYDFFCENIPNDNAHILELGCGPGNITRYLLSQKPNWQILGTDIAPNMVALAQANNPTARFEVRDCRQISDLPQPFDGIVAGFCLPYLSETEAEKFVADARQLLKPQGVLYVSFVGGNAELSGFKTNGEGDRVYFYYHDTQQISLFLEKYGFEMLQRFAVNYPLKDQNTEIHDVWVCRLKQ